MGFHDVEWAYSIDRPLAETAVLAALCHRTDDATHTTFVGQQAIAEMIGSSPEKVLRALKSLELAGVITRTRRHGAGGYRTSDLIRANVDTYPTNLLVGETPSGQNAYQENRRHLPDDSSTPTWQIVTAEEINQTDHSEDQPVSPSSREIENEFDRAYASWPKKVERKRSLEAFKRAAKKRGVEDLVADVIRFGDAYRASTDPQYVPALCVWLRGERWTDDLPAPKAPSDAEWGAFLAEEDIRDGFKFSQGKPVIGGPNGMNRDQYEAWREAQRAKARPGARAAGGRLGPDDRFNDTVERGRRLAALNNPGEIAS